MIGGRIGNVVAQRPMSDAHLPIIHGMTSVAPSVVQCAVLAVYGAFQSTDSPEPV